MNKELAMMQSRKQGTKDVSVVHELTEDDLSIITKKNRGYSPFSPQIMSPDLGVANAKESDNASDLDPFEYQEMM